MRGWRGRWLKLTKTCHLNISILNLIPFIYPNLALSPLNLKKVVIHELFYYSALDTSP